MKPRPLRTIRPALAGVPGVMGVDLHRSHPEWGYVPLVVWCVLMAMLYGASTWLWA